MRTTPSSLIFFGWLWTFGVRPREWLARHKSGLLHAIGFERVALLRVRAGFGNSVDPRAAWVAEVERLRDVIELLREEIPIKDALDTHSVDTKIKECPCGDIVHKTPGTDSAIAKVENMIAALAGHKSLQ